jgi:malonate transporter and related proteins
VPTVVLLRLAAIFLVIAVGWVAGRSRVVGPHAADTLGKAAFNVFTPALLFRTTAGVSVAALPWPMLAVYFLPTLALLLATYTVERIRGPASPVGPSVRGLSVTFSNTVQLGIPVVTALFGTAGLTVHIAIISLQALVLLTTATVLAENDLGGGRSLRARVAQTARRSVVHPVVLPILLGLGYNATGLAIPPVIDDVLATLGAAVVPLSLVTIGLSLHLYGVRGSVRPAAVMSVGKLVLHPALVFATAWLFGLHGLPLVVAVLCAALPTGANVLLFAGRYAVEGAVAVQAETTATTVLTTTAFVVTATGWLIVLSPAMVT